MFKFLACSRTVSLLLIGLWKFKVWLKIMLELFHKLFLLIVRFRELKLLLKSLVCYSSRMVFSLSASNLRKLELLDEMLLELLLTAP